MSAKTNLSDRLSLFAKMQTECQAAMAKGREEAAALRKSILGEGQPQEYTFRFALQSGDQNRIATALRELGEELYASAKPPRRTQSLPDRLLAWLLVRIKMAFSLHGLGGEHYGFM